MAKNNTGLILGVGAATLLLMSGKKKKKSASSAESFDEDVIAGGDESEAAVPDFNSVTFSPDFSDMKVGGGWSIRVLDDWLNDRRLAGKLLTKDNDDWSLYQIFVDNPTTFLGDITGTGQIGGSFIYGTLWLVAASGLGVFWAGASGLGTTGSAALANASQVTRAGVWLRQAATGASSRLTKAGWASSRGDRAMKTIAAAENLHKTAKVAGVSRGVSLLSTGAGDAGKLAALSILAEAGIDSAFGPDLAASAVEAAAQFVSTHSVSVGGADISIAVLPSGDEFPKVQEFNKYIMNYIIKFQKSTFEG